MSNFAQELGCRVDLAPAVLVVGHRNRYLFNCPEGIQRYCLEYKLKPLKCSHVWATRMAWDSLGGAFGFALTYGLAGPPAKPLNFYTPGDLGPYLESGKAFCGVNYMRHKDVSTVETFADDELQMRIFARPSPRSADPSFEGSADRVLSFVGHFCDKPGTLDVEKAKALGVPPGRLFGQLKRGEAVQVPDGRIVQPDEVLSPPLCPPAFAILDVSPAETLDSLRPVAEHFASLDRDGTVYHMAAWATVHTPEYADLLNAFGPRARHVVMDPEQDRRITHLANATNQCILNTILPPVFPRPYGVEQLDVPTLPTEFSPASTQQMQQEGRLVASDPLRITYLRADVSDTRRLLSDKRRTRQDRGRESKRAKTEATEANSEVSTATDLADNDGADVRYSEQARQLMNREAILRGSWMPVKAAEAAALVRALPEYQKRLPTTKFEDSASATPSWNNPVVHFLGTGSAVPSKYRNVTSMLVAQHDDEAALQWTLLMDAGEGSTAQLLRLLGPTAQAEHLAKLAVVHISHVHADHLLGMPGLMRARKRARAARGEPNSPLCIVGPMAIMKVLRTVGFVPKRDFYFLRNDFCFPAELQQDESSEVEDSGLVKATRDALASTLAKMQLSLQTLPVNHCRHATGLSLRSTRGWSLTWSGDTRPCDVFARFCPDVDLMIHEATFEAELQADAVGKRHSTTEEAITIANDTRARALLLTHFSQRYPRIPKPESAKPNMPTAVAFDLMSIPLRAVEGLAPYLDVLQYVFEQFYSEEDADELE
ncbi:uncharacterized protein MONBRDRAFT_23750 [Monosiga brevicollis MX1]|uniref:ribonuclease Z n=1 Tax=Monosiga brevicollis TaxID=81824 RepID=A9UUQ6_MONBE|nr:uncharacterized protein MONBRDRAFT_23750 [Monosiga brevicollis MX1]EDQ90945.1 predicted protein [Monosiga brevicollis MX1]|eukprot:XP_001744242.1 hypothetical protein [Monosiga brevicollis MX1]